MSSGTGMKSQGNDREGNLRAYKVILFIHERRREQQPEYEHRQREEFLDDKAHEVNLEREETDVGH